MKTQIHISIPTPCHESWDAMDATDKGAFCHSCRKEVIDFSTMTDREVIAYLERHKTGCGRFRNNQLDTTLSISEVDNGWFKWRALLLGLLPILSTYHVVASGAALVPTDQSAIDSHKKDTIATAVDHDIEVCGTVVDEKGEGLIGAAVMLVDASGKNSGTGASADIDGNYSFRISKELFNSCAHQLKAVSIGYQPKMIRMSQDPSQEYNIAMEVSDVVLQGDIVMVVGGMRAYHPTKTQKIKNWFRRTFHPHPKY